MRLIRTRPSHYLLVRLDIMTNNISLFFGGPVRKIFLWRRQNFGLTHLSSRGGGVLSESSSFLRVYTFRSGVSCKDVAAASTQGSRRTIYSSMQGNSIQSLFCSCPAFRACYLVFGNEGKRGAAYLMWEEMCVRNKQQYRADQNNSQHAYWQTKKVSIHSSILIN